MQSRIFMGCLITSEIRMHLRKSHTWQLALVDPHSSPLVETHYQNHTYVGRFLIHSQIPFDNLQEHQDQILAHLTTFCPSLNPETFQIKIFPQVFIQ